MPILNHILIFPIKSLDGVAVQQARISPGGSLEGDREFAIVDRNGHWINGKRTAKIHQLRSQFDRVTDTVTLLVSGEQPATFHLRGDRLALESWLSDYFGFAVHLQQNLTMGFPDDPLSPGPTIISSPTLETVASWYSGITLSQARARFRTNLEFGNVSAFWEDGLYAATATPVTFRIGEVEIQGINPCQRCLVPTRDPLTGKPLDQFQKIFVAQRQATLPAWAAVNRFNHFYRLAVNTRIAPSETGKLLGVGDEWSEVN